MPAGIANRIRENTNYCDNASRFARNLVSGGCVDNKAQYKVRITYNAFENNSHEVCENCKDRLKKDCEKYGHEYEVEEL